MKIGLIGRADNTGLGIQTSEFARHMNPEKVLIVDVCHLSPKKLSLYPERFMNEDGILPGRIFKGIPDSETLDWFLEGLDLVYTAETPYNYELFAKAKERGVKTVLHMNPEFNDYHLDSRLPLPTVFALPTHWKYDEIPHPKAILPVPIATEHSSDHGQKIRDGKTPHFLHVVGHPAVHDRNGTRDIFAALPHTTKPMTITFTCQDPDYVWDIMKEVAGVGGIPRYPDDVVIVMDKKKYDNYWEIYSAEAYDAMIMPRRFGGLCLPAHEALASGIPVVMPNVSPNDDLLPHDWLMPAEKYGYFMARMPVDLYRTEPTVLASYLDKFADRKFVDQQRWRASLYANPLSWKEQKDHYEGFFMSLVNGTFEMFPTTSQRKVK